MRTLGAIAAALTLVVVLAMVLLETDPGGRSGERPTVDVDVDEERGSAARPGDAVDVGIRIQPEGDVAWVIRASDADGATVADIEGRGSTPVAGRIPVDGWARLEVEADGHVGAVLDASRLARRPDRPFVLTLRKYARIRVVTSLDGLPRDGIPVRIRLVLTEGSWNLSHRVLEQVSKLEQGVTVLSGANGVADFDELPAVGRYELSAARDCCRPVSKRVTPRAGTLTEIAFGLRTGVVFKGVLLDHRGKPIPGAKVEVMREVKIGTARSASVSQEIDSRTHTDEAGSFTTEPVPLDATPTLWVRVMAEADGVAQVINQRLPRGTPGATMDVGEIRPLDTLVTFRFLDLPDPEEHELFAHAFNQPVEAYRRLAVFARLDGSGIGRIAGLPVGELVFQVTRVRYVREGIVDRRPIHQGEVRLERKVATFEIRVPPPEPPVARKFGPAPIVACDPSLAPHARFIVTRSAAVVTYFDLRPSSRLRVPAQLEVGEYELIMVVGERVAVQEFEIRESGSSPPRLDNWQLQEGRRAKVRVLREGEPVGGATVRVRGFRIGCRGLSVEWGTTGEDGLLELRGLPPACESICIGAMEGGVGRVGEFELASEPLELHIPP